MLDLVVEVKMASDNSKYDYNQNLTPSDISLFHTGFSKLVIH